MKFYDRIDVSDVLALIRQASFKNVLLSTIGILTMSIEIDSIAILMLMVVVSSLELTIIKL